MIILIAILIISIVIVCYSAARVSGDISRQEEEHPIIVTKIKGR